MEYVQIKMDDGCDDLFPKKSHNDDAGYDIMSTENIVLKKGEVKAVPVGFRLALPKGWEAQIRPRSGLAVKHGISVENSPGTIDSNYRGPVKVIIRYLGTEGFNLDEADFKIERGDRIAQMVINKLSNIVLLPSEDLDETDRGEMGFGSTGL